MKLWAGASAGAAIAWGLKLLVPTLHPIPLAMVVLGAYGVTYFAVTTAFGLPEARTVVGRLLRELRITKH